MQHSNRKILIVDDEPDNLAAEEMLLKLVLQLSSEVKKAFNGHEALAILNGNPADVIITDLQMPGMSGDELVRRVRARKDIRQPCIIGVSGNEDARKIFTAAGTNYVETKPFEIESVIADLDDYFGTPDHEPH